VVSRSTGSLYAPGMWILSPAVAAPAVVEVRADHSVVGTVALPITPERLRERLADPTWIASIDGGGTTVTVESRAGDCLTMESVSPSVVKTVRYRVERCRTATGFEENLVASDTFEAYRVRWTVEPAPEGALLRYDIATRTSLMVPQWLIDQQTQRGVQRMLDHLHAALSAQSP
jgi:hypothetical protein